MMDSARTQVKTAAPLPRGWIILGLTISAWALVFLLWQVFGSMTAAIFG
jgi:hypothetical protein